MKYVGELIVSSAVGNNRDCCKRTMRIIQSAYIFKSLERFDMVLSTSMSTPMTLSPSKFTHHSESEPLALSLA